MFFPTPPQQPQLSITPPADPAAAVRVMQIITGALMMGLIMFGVIANVLVFGGEGLKDKPPLECIVPLMAVGFAVLIIINHFIVPETVINTSINTLKGQVELNEITKGHFFPIFQVGLIIRLALLEGAGFFNLVAFIIDKQWWSLAVVALLLALMAIRFPTMGQVDAWAEDRLRQLKMS